MATPQRLPARVMTLGVITAGFAIAFSSFAIVRAEYPPRLKAAADRCEH